MEIDASAVLAVLTHAYSRKASEDEDAATVDSGSAAASMPTAAEPPAASDPPALQQPTDQFESEDDNADNQGIGGGTMVVAIFDYVGEESKELTFEAVSVEYGWLTEASPLTYQPDSVCQRHHRCHCYRARCCEWKS